MGGRKLVTAFARGPALCVASFCSFLVGVKSPRVSRHDVVRKEVGPFVGGGSRSEIEPSW